MALLWKVICKEPLILSKQSNITVASTQNASNHTSLSAKEPLTIGLFVESDLQKAITFLETITTSQKRPTSTVAFVLEFLAQ